MAEKVLFTSERPLARAENIKAVYNAYMGQKAFMQIDRDIKVTEVKRLGYRVMVTDEFPYISPGRVIMIGHGIDGGKTYGLDQPHPYINAKTAKLMDYYVTSGDGTVQMAARCSGVSMSSVLPLGVPRTDEYIGKKKGDGGTELARCRSYLYVPTYRGRGETPLPEIDWDWIDDELCDDELLAIKAHPMTKGADGRKYRHIIEIPSSEPSDNYLIDCDVMITDYSSIIFDGYLLNKPCVLFEKVKGYTETRGMYFKYPDQYSSRYAMNECELIDALRGANGLQDVEKRIIYQVANRCDGHATERVCWLIKEVVEGRR